MDRAQLPLNALRAFEAAARHLSFNKAGLELKVGDTAISHHVLALEQKLGVRLFRRLPRGLALTDEGQALLPTLTASLDQMSAVLDRFSDGRFLDPVSVGVVSSFAVRWLLPRLPQFAETHPHIDVRLSSHNNRVDPVGEGLDFAIRFGAGAWFGCTSVPLIAAPLALFAATPLAENLPTPSCIFDHPLLRSFRADEWPRWCEAAEVPVPALRGPQFDSSAALADGARQGLGLALLPKPLFASDTGLVSPFTTQIETGRYWLSWPLGKALGPAQQAFRDWLQARATA
jgi:LysR family transcriptional regulator, regulator of gene expression of beta-lactamase